MEDFTESPLPIDLVDLILSFLHSNVDILTTCAQSHLTLSKLSKRYIYAHVTLRDDLVHLVPPTDPFDDLHRIEPPINLRTSKFAQILATKSDIANHVRSLTVAWVKGDPGSEQDNATSSHLDGVASLLPLLIRLTAFTLTGSFFSSTRITWHSMPEMFRQAFLQLFHPPLVIKDIIISHIASFPMSLLNNCRNVNMTLRFCEDTQYDKESSNPEDVFRSSPMPFEHLSIEYCSETCLRNITPWAAMHGLRSLEYVDHYADSFAQILVACSDSLTNLHVDIDHIQTSFYYDPAIHTLGGLVHFPFALSGLHHLIQLTIQTESTFHRSDEGIWNLDSPIPAIMELISTARPNLKKISLEILFAVEVLDLEGQHLPGPVIVWDPFIPLTAKCSSASISMHISPSFECDIRASHGGITDYDVKDPAHFFPLLADLKGLTAYVQNGVVIIWDDFFQ